jgi:hypothetical protein
MREMRMAYQISVGKPTVQKHYSGVLGIDGILLKCILKN